MFNFKKKTVNPLVRAALSEIDFSIKVEGAQEKVEKLLSVDEMVVSEFSKTKDAQIQASSSSITTALAGLAVAAVGLLSSGGIVLLGAAVVVVGFATSLKYAANADRVATDMGTLREIIGTEVAQVAEKSPAEAIKSPRFLKSIAESFKAVARDTLSGNPDKLRARVAVTVPAAPTAPAVPVVPAAKV